MFTFTYILSQFFIILDYIFLVISSQLKNKKNILYLNILAQICAIISYFLLDAFSGANVAFVSIVRNVLFLKTLSDNKHSKNNYIILSIIIILVLLCSISTFTNWYSILPVLATMLYTICLYIKDLKLFKFLCIFVSIFWIAYNLIVMSIFGVILESILLISALIGYFRVYKLLFLTPALENI